LEGFAAEIQRKIGTMQGTLSEKNQLMKELAKKEFIRQYEKESVTGSNEGCFGATQKQVL
jgi:hypothetical protein